MAKTAVVFSGRNGLDFSELRGGVLRIPDVTIRIREAQRILDATEVPETDLMATIAADDDHFFRNIKMKSLASAIVQVGLFDRLLRTQRRPDYMVGNSNGDSAMLVCAGKMSFQEMVEKSQAVEAFKPSPTPEANVVSLNGVAGIPYSLVSPTPVSAAAQLATRWSDSTPSSLPLGASAAGGPVLGLPLLSGLSLTEYSAMKAHPREGGAPEYMSISQNSMELRKIIANLHQEHEVTRFLSIGPASALRGSDYRALGSGDVESLDSIDLDPMLGWFWRNVRPQASALAQ